MQSGQRPGTESQEVPGTPRAALLCVYEAIAEGGGALRDVLLASRAIDVARLQAELNSAPTRDPSGPSRRQLQAVGCDPRRTYLTIIAVFYDVPPPVLFLEMVNAAGLCVPVDNGDRIVHAPPWLIEQYTRIAPKPPEPILGSG